MKTTLAAIALTLSSQAFASQLSTIKVFDGTSAYCRSEKDVLTRGNAIGLYRVKATKVALKENKVDVQLQLRFLKCEKSDKGYGFTEVAPLGNSQSFLGFDGASTQVTTENVHVKGYKDGVYRVLFNEKVTQNAGQQNLSVSIPVEEILENATENRNKFDASFDVFIIKKLKFERSNGEMSFHDRVPYGSFRVRMNLDLEKGTAQLK